MSWTELRALINALPATSATKAAVSGDDRLRRWSEDTYIAAMQVNLTQSVIQVLWAGLGIKGDPPKFAALTGPQQDVEHAAKQQRKSLQLARLNQVYREQMKLQPGPARPADPT